MSANIRQLEYVLCVRNDNYPASLELRKVYRVLPDEDASAHDLIRVIDESGEDYLYPQELFVTVELPRAADAVFSQTDAT
jgi:hypothetical protein